MKKPWNTKFSRFMAGRGFYIALFLCVTAIGTSGYLLFSADSGDPVSDAQMAASQTQMVLPSAQISPESTGPAPVQPSPAATAKPTAKPTPAPDPSPSPSPNPTAAPDGETPAVFVRPIAGETVTAFSSDELIYNDTFRDWRLHDAIDIEADVGAKVMAIAAGTVSDLYEDDLMGTTVVISHKNNLTSLYSNLAALPTVEVGDTVQAGDIIGAVGKTAIGESSGPPHLHFTLQKNGIAIDPETYLPDWTI